MPVNTAEQLLSELDKYLHNGFGDLDSVIFRGVPDSTFELVPTALRSGAASLSRFQDFNQYSSADTSVFFQKLVEWGTYFGSSISLQIGTESHSLQCQKNGTAL